MEVNLRPADYVGQRTFYLPRFLKLFLGVSYLLALVVLPGGQFLLNGQLEAETQALSATLESRRAEAEQLRTLLAAGNLVSAQAKRLEEQLASRYHWSVSLRELEQVAGTAGVTLQGFFWQQTQADLHARAAALYPAGRWPGVVESTASFAGARLQSIEKVEGGFMVLMTAEVDREAARPATPAAPPAQEEPTGMEAPPVEKPAASAPPAAEAETEAPAIPAPGEYIVQRNDNLSQIARRFGLTLVELLEANPQIKNPSMIVRGQRIKLPAAEN